MFEESCGSFESNPAFVLHLRSQTKAYPAESCCALCCCALLAGIMAWRMAACCMLLLPPPAAAAGLARIASYRPRARYTH
jgi:hypothetical protein